MKLWENIYAIKDDSIWKFQVKQIRSRGTIYVMISEIYYKIIGQNPTGRKILLQILVEGHLIFQDM